MIGWFGYSIHETHPTPWALFNVLSAPDQGQNQPIT